MIAPTVLEAGFGSLPGPEMEVLQSFECASIPAFGAALNDRLASAQEHVLPGDAAFKGRKSMLLSDFGCICISGALYSSKIHQQSTMATVAQEPGIEQPPEVMYQVEWRASGALSQMQLRPDAQYLQQKPLLVAEKASGASANFPIRGTQGPAALRALAAFQIATKNRATAKVTA